MMDSARGKRSDFALAVTSVEGSQWTAGDCDRQFNLQSLSKTLAYARALGLVGEDAVSKKVDVEQSGEPFNAVELEEGTGRPSNAMLTAGAIAIAGLVVETRALS